MTNFTIVHLKVEGECNAYLNISKLVNAQSLEKWRQ